MKQRSHEVLIEAVYKHARSSTRRVRVQERLDVVDSRE